MSHADAKSDQTKEKIASTFLLLLNTYPLNEISIKHITKTCGINRNTFYYHYADLPALAEEIVTERLDLLILDNADFNSLEQSFLQGIRFATENKRAMYHIYNSVNRDIFEQYLMKSSEYVVKAYVNNALKDSSVSEQDRTLLIRHYKYVCFGTVIDWMENGMQNDIKADIHRICELLTVLLPVIRDSPVPSE